MKQLIIIALVTTLAFTGCTSGKAVSATQAKPVEKVTYENANYRALVDTSDIKTDMSALGGNLAKHYNKYIDYVAPNGKPIRIVAAEKVSNEQVLRAYNVLSFYLEGNPNLDMTEVANNMANQQAVLNMPGGTDGDGSTPDGALTGQPLYQNETPLTASKWYIDNDYTHRDAALEEILHMVHDYGIGTKSSKGAMPALQKEIYKATMNALPKDQAKWGTEGLWGLNSRDWLLELHKEGSLEQEYLASVVDSYYGMWSAYTENKGGMWGLYTSKARADIKQNDPMGYALAQKMFSPTFTQVERLDPSFKGTFKMFLDEKEAYTYKSQYLDNVRVTGSESTTIYGNDRDNLVIPGKGNLIVNGGQGTDVVQVLGKSTDYTLKKVDATIVIMPKNDKEGTITVTNVEILRCTDKDITL